MDHRALPDRGEMWLVAARTISHEICDGHHEPAPKESIFRKIKYTAEQSLFGGKHIRTHFWLNLKIITNLDFAVATEQLVPATLAFS